MILDKELICSDDQAITVTADATNVIDTEACGTPWMASTALVRNIHKGVPIPFLIQVTTAFTAGGAATLVSNIVSDSQADLDGSPVTLFTSAAIAVASLIAGYKIFDGYLNSVGADMKRFLGVEYVVATGPMLTGNMFAGITGGNQSNF